MPRPRKTRRPKDLLVTTAGTLAGLGLGLLWALPLANPNVVCPPAGEGRVQCELDKVWLTVGTRLMFSAIACVLLLRFVLKAPELWRARREGRLVGGPVRAMAPDTRLVAASWGHTYAVEGETRVLRRPRLAWQDPRELPLDEHGTLSDDALRAWLRDTQPATA